MPQAGDIALHGEPARATREPTRMQQYQGQQLRTVKGSRVATFLKRLFLIAIVGAVAVAIIYASSLPSVQKQLGGRRGKLAGGDAAVPVTVAQARVSDVP